MPQRAWVGADLRCAVPVLPMRSTRGHTSGGEDHSLWSYYSEEVEEGSRERKLGPALRILLIRFPNLRSQVSRMHNAQESRIRPYSKYLIFKIGASPLWSVRCEDASRAVVEVVGRPIRRA